MAQKLNSQYKYDYANLKVLLGGWNTWKEFNVKDANQYPIDTATGGAAPVTNNNPAVVNPVPVQNTPAP